MRHPLCVRGFPELVTQTCRTNHDERGGFPALKGMSVNKQKFTQPLWLDPDAIKTTLAQGQALRGQALEPKWRRLFVC